MMKRETAVGHVQQCQVCAQTDVVTILSLGHHPPVHAHLTAEQLHAPEVAYPLHLCYCRSCGLVQLDYIVDPRVVFYPEYPYQTGMTDMLVRNFLSMRDMVMERYALSKDDVVADIGSNDGTLLAGFKARGVGVVGVEPTNVAKLATERGIPTIQDFFAAKVVAAILRERGPAKIITATNVFAHINKPLAFVQNIKKLLAADGVFVSESQYLRDVVEKLELDTIYHEHLRYYSLKPLIELFSRVGMRVVHAERITAAGGSIRVYAAKDDQQVDASVDRLVKEEEEAGLYDERTLLQFGKRAIEAKHQLLTLMLSCKKQGRVVGIGAPARSNTLLNFAKIDGELLSYACERAGSPKIGLYTPGMHVPIVEESRLFQEQPEYALMLSWHIGDELMQKLRGRGYRGKFIMPLPTPRVIE